MWDNGSECFDLVSALCGGEIADHGFARSTDFEFLNAGFVKSGGGFGVFIPDYPRSVWG